MPEPLLSTQAPLPHPTLSFSMAGRRFSFGPITLSNAFALCSLFSSPVSPLRVPSVLRDWGRRQGQAGQGLQPEGLRTEACLSLLSLPLGLPPHLLGWGQEGAREGEARGSGKVAVEAALNPGLLCGWKYPLRGSWP